jgi:hypothetical protein
MIVYPLFPSVSSVSSVFSISSVVSDVKQPVRQHETRAMNVGDRFVEQDDFFSVSSVSSVVKYSYSGEQRVNL